MLYSGYEIVEIAVRIEENGFAFYTEGAQAITDNQKIKNLFTDLAKKETHHVAVFRNLLSKWESESLEFSAEEFDSYLQHVANTHIFHKKDSGIAMAKTIKNAKHALEIAYKFETDSVEFYTEMLKRTESDAVQLIKRIIDEEKEHAREIKSYMV